MGLKKNLLFVNLILVLTLQDWHKKSIALVGAFILGASGTVAHAEEVVTTIKTTEPTTATTETTTKEVTKADVDAAKTTLDKATAETSAQATVVAEATKATDTVTQDLATAQTNVADAEKLVAQATSEAIAKAETAVTTAKAEVAKAETTVTDSKTAVTTAEKAVTAQESVVKSTQDKVDVKTAEVAKAQADLNSAQAILDGTGQAQVVKAAEDATKQLEADKASLIVAQNNLESAKTADAQRQANIDTAQATVATAKTTLANATAESTKADTLASQTSQKLAEVTDQLKVAENDYNAINTITVTADYVSALKDYALNYATKGAEAKIKLNAMAADLRKANIFKANANDDKTFLDTNNLSDETIKELSLFASDLVNQIRKAFGTQATVVTPGAIKLADLTTDGYVADNWSVNDVMSVGHDAKAVNRAAESLGLRTTTTQQELKGTQLYENMLTNFASSPDITFSEAKSFVYDAIIQFMFNGYEYLHAESVAGLVSKDQYLAVDLSSRDGVSSVHLITVGDNHLKEGSTFDKTAITNPKSAETVKLAYDIAKANVTNATEANNLAQADKMIKAIAKADAQNALTLAESTLTKAESVPVKTAEAQAILIKVQEQVKSSTDVYNKAQEAVKSLEADVKVKQANVVAAKAVLETKQSELVALQAQLSTEQKALESAKTAKNEAVLKLRTAEQALESAKADVVTAENYLELLKSASAKLSDAQTALKSAESRLGSKQMILAEAQEKLDVLKVAEKVANEEYQKLLSAYEALLEAQRQAQLAKEYADLVKAGKTPLAVTDQTGKVTGYIAEVKVETVKTVAKQTLPETGTEESGLGIVGMSMTLMSLLTLGYKSKKEN